MRSAVLLNSCLKFPKLSGVRDASGGCPGGVPFDSQRYQTIKIAAIIPTSLNAYLIFRVGMSHPASRLATTCGKRITRRTIRAAPQNRAMLNGLRFWHWLRRTYN